MNKIENRSFWKIVFVIAVLLIVPFVINFLIQIPRFTDVIGEEKDWLAFHGSYIGAIVGAGISFLIMYRTLEYHKKEDRYRHNIEWLNNFRMVCVDYLSSYNLDNVYSILNELTIDAEIAYNHCINYKKQLINKETMMSLTVTKTQDDNLSKLFDKLQSFQEQYRSRFSDITKVVFDAMHACKRDNQARYIYDVELTDEISESLNNLLKANMDSNRGMYVNVLAGWLSQWISEIEQQSQEVSDACKQYIIEKAEEIEMRK